MKLIHLTDPHLPPPGHRLYGLDPNERFKQAIGHINANHADASLVLVTGDLTNDGVAASYEALRSHLGALRVPWRLLLGNHEERTLFRTIFPEAPADENGFIQSAYDTEDATILLLDTHEPGTPSGRLCEKRLGWLSDQLAARPEKDIYLAMHHPPLDLGLPGMDAIGLIDKKPFAETLAGHDRIRHIFFGHVHRLVTGSWRGIPFTGQRGVSHQLALTMTRTSGYPGSLESPTYGVVLIRPEGAIVHVCDFLDPSPAFDLVDPAAIAARSVEDLAGIARTKAATG